MIDHWLQSVTSASIRGGIAVAIAWVFCQIPRVPAAVQCWIWRGGYAVLITAFLRPTSVELPLLRPSVVSTPTGSTTPTYFTGVATGDSAQQLDSPTDSKVIRPAPAALHPSIMSPSVVPTTSSGARWPIAAFIAWAVLVGFCLVRLALGWIEANRIRRRCQPIEIAGADDLASAMGLRRAPTVLACAAVDGPMLVGLLRPIIVLPLAMVESIDIRSILAHEMSHLRRRDLLWNWLPTLGLILLPFHPMVWIANRRWRLATESACDADAVAVTSVSPADYARLLVRVAAPPTLRGLVAAGSFAETGFLLKKRITAMSHLYVWNRRASVAMGMLIAAVTVLTAVPWRVVAQQPPATTAPAVVVPAAPTTSPAQSINASATGVIKVRTANIRSLVAGTIDQIDCVEGQAVKKSELLVELDAKDQVASVKSATDILDACKARQDQLKPMFKSGLATQADVLQAELELARAKDVVQQRQNELAKTRTVAPFDGTVTILNASAGNSVLPGDPIAIVISKELEMEFSVPTHLATALKAGATIQLSTESGTFTQEIGTATVTSIEPDNGEFYTVRVAGKSINGQALQTDPIVRVRAKVGTITQKFYSDTLVTVGFHVAN